MVVGNYYVDSLPPRAKAVNKYWKFNFVNLFYSEGLFYTFHPRRMKYYVKEVKKLKTPAYDMERKYYSDKYVNAKNADGDYVKIYYAYFNKADVKKYDFLKTEDSE